MYLLMLLSFPSAPCRLVELNLSNSQFVSNIHSENFISFFNFQVVVAPILLGSYAQSKFPAVVKVVTPFAPLLAVLTSSLLACRFGFYTSYFVVKWCSLSLLSLICLLLDTCQCILRECCSPESLYACFIIII